tara:strand:+ start:557 stop:883 length:327 start_codon:yes stop_codon:yes gene_type:complete
MSEEVETVEETKEESRFDCYSYSSQVLLENTTLEKANDKSFPSDTFLVWYNVEGKECLDVARSSKQVNLFDMYYDKYKKDLKRIEWGYGTVNPTNWGYKQPDRKKKRK